MTNTCTAKTKKGSPCTRRCLPYSHRCWQHTFAKHPYVMFALTLLGLALSVWSTFSQPNPAAVDPETLAKIVNRYELDLDQRDTQIETLEAALKRVQANAAAGDQDAKDALAEARRSGDIEKLQAVLTSHADGLEDRIEASTAVHLELCREISVIAYLRGDIPEARKRLEIILAAKPDDKDAINRLGHIYSLLGKLDDAQRAYRRVLDLSSPDEVWRAVAYGNIGLIYRKRGDLDQAEKMLRKALEIFENLGRLEGMASQYGNLGLIYKTRGDLDQAEAMHRKSLEINEKLGRLVGMARDYGNLGLIHRTRGDLDQAEAMHRNSLEINEKLGRLEGMANAYGNLGLIYQARGDLDQAEKMHRKSLEIFEELGGLEGMASGYGNLGLIYGRRGDLDQAEAMHRKSLEIFEKLGGLEGMANAYGNLGLICQTRGDLKEARSLWTRARDLYDKIGMPHMVAKIQGWLDALPPEAP